jgi:hypothetical protein
MSNNENSVIEYLKANNEALFDKIVNALRKGKQVNFTDINQSDIIILSPQKAFEYAGEEGDKYFKVWMVGSTIAWCTWANSMVDSDFRWNAKARNENKRDNKDILGNEPYISAYLKSNSAIEQCSVVYMFPFEAFSKKKVEVVKKVEEKESKTEKVVKKTTSEPNSEKVEEIIDELSDLTIEIEQMTPSLPLPGVHGMIMKAFEKRNILSERAEFDTKLMRLKCLDEHNKMIPYFEKKAQEWDEKKAGVFEKIAKVLKNNK